MSNPTTETGLEPIRGFEPIVAAQLEAIGSVTVGVDPAKPRP